MVQSKSKDSQDNASMKQFDMSNIRKKYNSLLDSHISFLENKVNYLKENYQADPIDLDIMAVYNKLKASEKSLKPYQTVIVKSVEDQLHAIESLKQLDISDQLDSAKEYLKNRRISEAYEELVSIAKGEPQSAEKPFSYDLNARIKRITKDILKTRSVAPDLLVAMAKHKGILNPETKITGELVNELLIEHATGHQKPRMGNEYSQSSIEKYKCALGRLRRELREPQASAELSSTISYSDENLAEYAEEAMTKSRASPKRLLWIIEHHPEVLKPEYDLYKEGRDKSNQIILRSLEDYAKSAPKAHGRGVVISQATINKYKAGIITLRERLTESQKGGFSQNLYETVMDIGSNQFTFGQELDRIAEDLESKLSEGDNLILLNVGKMMKNMVDNPQLKIESTLNLIASIYKMGEQLPVTPPSEEMPVAGPMSIEEAAAVVSPEVIEIPPGIGGPCVFFEDEVEKYQWQQIKTDRDATPEDLGMQVPMHPFPSLPNKMTGGASKQVETKIKAYQKEKEEIMVEVAKVNANRRPDEEVTIPYLKNELEKISEPMFGVGIDDRVLKHMFKTKIYPLKVHGRSLDSKLRKVRVDVNDAGLNDYLITLTRGEFDSISYNDDFAEEMRKRDALPQASLLFTIVASKILADNGGLDIAEDGSNNITVTVNEQIRW